MIDRDTWIAADQMITLYGDDAAVIAAQYADARWEQGDQEGYEAWSRVLFAIGEMRSTEPDGAVN
jgi:hypothetical protein